MTAFLGATSSVVATTTSTVVQYEQLYSYDALGNILSKNDQGTYAYAGNTGSSYANPHAVTSVSTSTASSTYSYDLNGNLTSNSLWSYSWDYRNRLTQAMKSPFTITSSYDHEDNRVKYSNGTTTTYYPSGYYDVTGATSTKNVYVGDRLVMNIDRSGSSTQRYFVHADLLGSTKALTTASGTVAESLEYYPFGSIKDDVGSRKESKKYIGAEYDEETGLNYLNARYQNGQTGKFISQDPVFWEIGQSDDGDKVLMDPQSQNSYSYVRNNPIINKDPKGRYWETVFDVAMLSWSLSDFKENPSFWNGLGVVADGASLALPIPAVVGGLRHGDDAYKGFRIAQDVARTSNWGNPASLMQHTFDHAIDFGLKKTDYAGYAKATNDFLSNAEVSVKQGSKNFESFVDSNNRTFFFDGNTSTFGIKNADGTAVTAYKPKGGDPQKALDYWNKQKIRYNGKK